MEGAGFVPVARNLDEEFLAELATVGLRIIGERRAVVLVIDVHRELMSAAALDVRGGVAEGG